MVKEYYLRHRWGSNRNYHSRSELTWQRRDIPLSKSCRSEVPPSDGLVAYPGHNTTINSYSTRMPLGLNDPQISICHSTKEPHQTKTKPRPSSHHLVMPSARISLTLSRHLSLSFIASGRCSELHPVFSQSCCM